MRDQSQQYEFALAMCLRDTCIPSQKGVPLKEDTTRPDALRRCAALQLFPSSLQRFGGFLKTQPAIADFDSRWVGNTSQKSTREREPSLLGQLNGSMFGACQKQNTKLPTASYGASVSFHEFHGQRPLCTAQGSKSNNKSRPQLRQLRQPSPHPPAPTNRWHLRWTSDRRASHRSPGRSSGGGAFPAGRRGPAAPRTSSCAPLSLAPKNRFGHAHQCLVPKCAC